MVKFFNQLDVSQFKNKEELEEFMRKKVGDNDSSITRIMRNFKYNPEVKQVQWKLRTQYIYDNIKSMYYFEPEGVYQGPARMLVGGYSNRWKLKDYIK